MKNKNVALYKESTILQQFDNKPTIQTIKRDSSQRVEQSPPQSRVFYQQAPPVPPSYRPRQEQLNSSMSHPNILAQNQRVQPSYQPERVASPRGIHQYRSS